MIARSLTWDTPWRTPQSGLGKTQWSGRVEMSFINSASWMIISLHLAWYKPHQLSSVVQCPLSCSWAIHGWDGLGLGIMARWKSKVNIRIFRNRYRYFFQNQIFSKPIAILFSIPNFFETDTNTFFDTKFFWNRYRYFFRYQKFSKPIPILFSIPNFSETDTDTFFDTKIFRNRYRYH